MFRALWVYLDPVHAKNHHTRWQVPVFGRFSFSKEEPAGKGRVYRTRTGSPQNMKRTHFDLNLWFSKQSKNQLRKPNLNCRFFANCLKIVKDLEPASFEQVFLEEEVFEQVTCLLTIT